MGDLLRELEFFSELFSRHMLAEFIVLIVAGLVANDWAGKFHWHPKNRKKMAPPWHHGVATRIYYLEEFGGLRKHDCVRVKWERGIWHIDHFVMDQDRCLFVSLRNAAGMERNVHHKVVRKHHGLVHH